MLFRSFVRFLAPLFGRAAPWMEVASVEADFSIIVGLSKDGWRERSEQQRAFLEKQDALTMRCPFIYGGGPGCERSRLVFVSLKLTARIHSFVARRQPLPASAGQSSPRRGWCARFPVRASAEINKLVLCRRSGAIFSRLPLSERPSSAAVCHTLAVLRQLLRLFLPRSSSVGTHRWAGTRAEGDSDDDESDTSSDDVSAEDSDTSEGTVLSPSRIGSRSLSASRRRLRDNLPASPWQI